LFFYIFDTAKSTNVAPDSQSFHCDSPANQAAITKLWLDYTDYSGNNAYTLVSTMLNSAYASRAYISIRGSAATERSYLQINSITDRTTYYELSVTVLATPADALDDTDLCGFNFAMTGPSGYSGYSGSGISGYSGYIGISGYSGYSSTSGYSGYSGRSGYSAYSGISGYSAYSGASGFSGFSGLPAVGVIFYPTNHDDLVYDPTHGVSGYYQWDKVPDFDAETSYNTTVASGDGQKLLVSLITNYGQPAITSIPVGVWRFNTFYAIDSANGVTTFVYKLYKRSNGGTETLIFSTTSDELTNTSLANPELFISNYAFTSVYYLDAADRLVLKIYVQTTHSSNITVYYYYEGTDHYSMLSTGIYEGSQGASGLSGYSGYIGPSGYSGYSSKRLFWIFWPKWLLWLFWFVRLFSIFGD
jgi:hypothetical protein